ncbi:MAG: DUF6174 domain-containing protein [Gammaproteobacteria bacterium]
MRYSILSLFAVTVLLLGCDDEMLPGPPAAAIDPPLLGTDPPPTALDPPSSAFAPQQADLDANRAKWDDSNIASYVYHWSYQCLCIIDDTIVVTVTNKMVTAGFYTPSGVAITQGQLDSMRTMEDFFDFIQALIDREPFDLDVDYDATYGYPTAIYVEYFENVLDAKVIYQISEFQ